MNKTARVAINGSIWAAVTAILVAVADMVKEPYKTIILTVVIPIITLLAKITPQPALLPGTAPQERASDDGDPFGAIFRR